MLRKRPDGVVKPAGLRKCVAVNKRDDRPLGLSGTAVALGRNCRLSSDNDSCFVRYGFVSGHQVGKQYDLGFGKMAMTFGDAFGRESVYFDARNDDRRMRVVGIDRVCPVQRSQRSFPSAAPINAG